MHTLETEKGKFEFRLRKHCHVSEDSVNILSLIKKDGAKISTTFDSSHCLKIGRQDKTASFVRGHFQYVTVCRLFMGILAVMRTQIGCLSDVQKQLKRFQL